MEDFFKSVKAILYDRVTSPLYGTFIVSWLLWNWKIPYVSFFVSESTLRDSKIDYIINNCNNLNNLVLFPIISTVLIITLIPLLSNGAFLISYKYEMWRKNKKKQLDNLQTLTIEQSVNLRAEMQELATKLEKTISQKDETIKEKESEIIKLSGTIIEKEKLNENNISEIIKRNDEIKELNKKSFNQNEKIIALANFDIFGFLNLIDKNSPVFIPTDIHQFFNGIWVKHSSKTPSIERFRVIEGKYLSIINNQLIAKSEFQNVKYNNEENVLILTTQDKKTSLLKNSVLKIIDSKLYIGFEDSIENRVIYVLNN